MISAIRSEYNKYFTEEKYQAFLADLNQRFNYTVSFRVAESPLFVDAAFKAKLIKASDEMIDFIVANALKDITKDAMPPALQVPKETKHPLFLALDFAIVKSDDEYMPKLIEMQGFPSLFGWQDFLPDMYRKHFKIPADMHSHLVKREVFTKAFNKVILNGHHPDNVILLEIDPMKQNTAIDFLVTEKMTGVKAVHIGDVKVDGKNLYYLKDKKRIPIHRIYNRVIFDELMRRTDLKLDFTLREEVDVEWAGHPNWFYRISKYTMPFIKSEYLPECKFLSQYTDLPEDLHNYVLKPLYSFSGSGVIFHVKKSDIDAIPEKERHYFILQHKVQYAPVLQAPDGLVNVEMRLLFIWEEDKLRPTLMTNLVRLSRGEMIGVKYNKDKTWVGGSVAFFES